MKLKRLLAITTGVLLLLTLAYVGIRLWSHHRLEQYKAELRSKGEKLTFAELVPTLSQTDDREFAFIAAGKALSHPQISPGTIHWLNEDPSGIARAIPPLEIIPTLAFSSQSPITNGLRWDDLAEALAARSDDLNVIRGLLQRPPTRTQVDYENVFDPPKFHFVEKRLAAQWLGASVLLHLRSNNMEAAISDLRSLLSITQWHAEEPPLTCQMTRIALTGLACEVTWQLLAHDVSPVESDLKALQGSLERIDLIAALERGMLAERNWGSLLFDFNREESGNLSKSFAAFTLTTTGSSSIPTPTVGDHLVGIAWRHTVADEDERFYLQFMQRNAEIIRLFQTNQNFLEIQRQLERNATHVSQVAASWQRLRYPFSTCVIPNFIRAHVTCARNETLRRLTVVAIAVKRFEFQNGHLPPDLNALVPQFVNTLPIDSMDAKPLKYRPNPDGTYLLYSVGEDGIDHGGDPSFADNTTEYGLWKGKDVVWPKSIR